MSACREVANAVESDPFCGPHVDAVKRLAGLEYEALLGQKLRALGVPFLTEDALRMRGEAKTPDALLSVPLLVRGRVVHWIDSKATFGDPWSHLEYHDNQYSSYLNRFGAGLVIYWAGFDESICDSDPRVLVAHDLLADQCELMTCLAHDAAVGPGAPMPPTPTPTPPGAPSSSGASAPSRQTPRRPRNSRPSRAGCAPSCAPMATSASEPSWTGPPPVMSM